MQNCLLVFLFLLVGIKAGTKYLVKTGGTSNTTTTPRSRLNNRLSPESGVVNCGGHTAPTCKDCPGGHGESYCNGECSWRYGFCLKHPFDGFNIRFDTATKGNEIDNEWKESVPDCIDYCRGNSACNYWMHTRRLDCYLYRNIDESKTKQWNGYTSGFIGNRYGEPKCPPTKPREGSSCNLESGKKCPYEKAFCCGKVLPDAYHHNAECINGKWSVYRNIIDCTDCNEGRCELDRDTAYYRNNVYPFDWQRSLPECVKSCKRKRYCKYFSYYHSERRCFYKSRKSGRKGNRPGFTSGSRNCDERSIQW